MQITLEDIARLAIKVHEAKHNFFEAINTDNFENCRLNLLSLETKLDTLISSRKRYYDNTKAKNQ